MAESPDVPRGLTIEHIMPQKWQENWPLPTDVTDVDRAVKERDHRNRIIHSIGNLTLVTGSLNTSLSNAPWADKRETLHQHTVLYLNKELLDEAPDVWNEAKITKRAKQLSKTAARVWPSPEHIERD